MIRVPVSVTEAGQLIRGSGPGDYAVHMTIGTGELILDLATENDRKVGEALVALREAVQTEKDRVGDPR